MVLNFNRTICYFCAINNVFDKISQLCGECLQKKILYSQNGKPPNNFKFKGTAGSESTWKVIDQYEAEPECVIIECVDFPDARLVFDFWQIWQGLDDGNYVIA